VHDTKTDTQVGEPQVHIVLMSDAELKENGLIKEKLKIAGRVVGKHLLNVLKKHVTDTKGRPAK